MNPRLRLTPCSDTEGFWLGMLASAVSHDLIWRRRGLDDKGRAMEKTLNEFLRSGVAEQDMIELLPKVPRAGRR